MDGFPVVMLHGWPESCYCWHHVIPHLTGNWWIITPDMRGLGDSERTLEKEAYAKDELAKDMLNLLTEMGITDFYLVGHDWGCAVAQEMAILEPARVKKFVLLNMSVIPNEKGNHAAQQFLNQHGNVSAWYQHFQQMPFLPEAMIEGNEEIWIRFFIRNAKQQPLREDAVQEYIRCYKIKNTPLTGANYYRMLRKDIGRWKKLYDHKFTMPSLYIYANQDRVIIPAFIEHVEDCFESIEIKQIKAGHFVTDEKPEEVAKYMNGFL